MPAIICLLRAVNVGGHGKIKMDALRALCTSLKLRNPQTYVQSGNVVFLSDDRVSGFALANPELKKVLDALASRIESAIEKKFGFRPPVILRTSQELRKIIAHNPFAKRRDIHPGKLLVVFLAADPAKDALQQIRAKNPGPEEVHLHGRELYVYYPNGVGRSKLTTALIDKATQTVATARNWNTVTRLLAMAEKLESRA